MRPRLLTAVAGAAILLVANQALAADCNVNVFDAYNTAKLRGWAFSCLPQPGIKGGFVPYPPPLSSVGCAFSTPPLPGGVAENIGRARLFERYVGESPHLKNGWQVKSFEISGGQWLNLNEQTARVSFRTDGPKQGNKTYNYYISKLTLTRSGGSCSNAIDQAF